VIVAGLVLAVGSTVAINAGYALQHGAASGLPPLTVRRPLASLRSLARTRRWVAGFAGGLGGWALYVVALGLAPLSLVQAASAGGIAVLALGAGRLRMAERLGVGVSVAGLLLLALSLGSHPVSGRGSSAAVAGWLLGSLVAAVAAARALPAGAGLGTAAGILYAAGEVATKPIAAGAVLFGERLPGGWQGSARLAAFAFVLAGAAALSRRTSEGSWATISTD
jgi:hypothetical protein